MTPPSLWDRIRRSRIVQVLAVYLGASWAVLQIADVLTGALSLPPWVLPVAVLLLLIGLVIIGATAWVQSHPATAQKEAAGEVPGDWEVAPAEALTSLKSGRLPHLTWGRAILGGVVAMVLLFGGAGAFVAFTGEGPRLGPGALEADVAAEGIAVVPFEVRGQHLEIWREGMVDLLANNLDGVGGFRTIDSRTVMARWKSAVGDVASADLEAALQVAGATGARYALVGSVVGLGSNVRLVANVYDLDTRKEVAQGQAEGPVDEVLRLVDDLAVGTIRSLLQKTGRQGAGDLRAETLTTTSLPALREFLEGERHFRKGDFAEAVQSYERGVAADSTFAIALVRLSEAYGWLENMGSEKMDEYGSRAMAHRDRLPPRYQFIMDAWDALNHGTAAGLPVLKAAVQKYPDDPEAWFLLAETYIHVKDATYASVPEIKRVLDRAVALDPNFGPYLVHQADIAVIEGDSVAAKAVLARYVSLSGNDHAVSYLRIAIPLLTGDSAAAAAALAAARTAPAGDLDLILGTYPGWTDRFDRVEQLNQVFAEVTGTNRDQWAAWLRVSQGAMRSAGELARTGQLSPVDLAVYLGHQFEQWGIKPDAALAGRLSLTPCLDRFNGGCLAFGAVALASLGRWSDIASASARARTLAAAGAAAGDSAGAAGRRATADVMDGVAAWHRGDAARAQALVEPHTTRAGLVGGRARRVMSELEFARGNHERAVHFAQGDVNHFGRARSLYVQARSYEAKGDRAKALAAWQHFNEVTRRGDPDLPQVREGREAVGRLLD